MSRHPDLTRRLVPAAAAAAVLVLLPAAAIAAETPGDPGPSAEGVPAYATRQVTRDPGLTVVDQAWGGPQGRSLERTRTTTRTDAAAVTEVTRTLGDGRTSASSREWRRHGDGSATRSRSHTGVRGGSQEGWTTIYRSDDGFGRSQGFSTASGRGGTRATDVTVGEGAVTVNRSARTNSGRERSSSRTFQRR